jgi:hypothetical protein
MTVTLATLMLRDARLENDVDGEMDAELLKRLLTVLRVVAVDDIDRAAEIVIRELLEPSVVSVGDADALTDVRADREEDTVPLGLGDNEGELETDLLDRALDESRTFDEVAWGVSVLDADEYPLLENVPEALLELVEEIVTVAVLDARPERDDDEDVVLLAVAKEVEDALLVSRGEEEKLGEPVSETLACGLPLLEDDPVSLDKYVIDDVSVGMADRVAPIDFVVKSDVRGDAYDEFEETGE